MVDREQTEFKIMNKLKFSILVPWFNSKVYNLSLLWWYSSLNCVFIDFIQV